MKSNSYKPIGMYECHIDAQSDYRVAAQRGYPLLIDKGQELKKYGVNFTDLTMIFANEHRSVYEDNCCHYNQLGNDLIADKILDVLSSHYKSIGIH